MRHVDAENLLLGIEADPAKAFDADIAIGIGFADLNVIDVEVADLGRLFGDVGEPIAADDFEERVL